MQRDLFTCRDCSATDQTLNVHHCHYAKGSPWNTAPALLLTLCEPCHKERQEVERKIKENIAIILASKPNHPDDPSLGYFAQSVARAADASRSDPTYCADIYDHDEVCDLWRKANLWDSKTAVPK